jgi:L-alanine-DL-glutamate epimerase-like enolase superfamily enzyme
MPSRSDVLIANLEELQEDLQDLWRTLTRDPKRELRKERAWTVLSGVFAALAAIAARRAATKIYGILTGESPPIGRQVPPPARGGPSSRRTEEPEQTPTTA